MAIYRVSRMARMMRERITAARRAAGNQSQRHGDGLGAGGFT